MTRKEIHVYNFVVFLFDISENPASYDKYIASK